MSPFAGFTIAFLWTVVILGANIPWLVELISRIAEEVGEVVPIPMEPPLLKRLAPSITHWFPSQYGVFPGADPFINNPVGP
jgi:hypothetical protein